MTIKKYNQVIKAIEEMKKTNPNVNFILSIFNFNNKGDCTEGYIKANGFKDILIINLEETIKALKRDKQEIIDW